MKRLALLFLMLILLNITVATAQTYTTDEAVDVLIPYEDDHVMTREECITALSRMIGVNDDKLIMESYSQYFDVNIKNDIDFYSFKGRSIFLADDLFEKSVAPTRTDFYFGNNNFYGDYPASVPDVLSWMIGVLYTEEPYSGKNNLIDCAYNAGLLNNDSESMQQEITARIFKILAGRFLECTVYDYIGEGSDAIPPQNYPIKRTNIKKLEDGKIEYRDSDLTYIDIFNQTYRNKNIYITNDGIYLGDSKVEFAGKQPFVDDNGTLLMPVRWLAQLFGFENVQYDENTGYVYLTEYKWLKNTDYLGNPQMVFRNGLTVYVFADSNIEPYDFEMPANIIDGCMYIPLRSVCESLLYNVVWDVK